MVVDSYSSIISAFATLSVRFVIIINMSAECIACQNPVRVRQQDLQCDGRFHWQHRTTSVVFSCQLPPTITQQTLEQQCLPQ